MTMLNPIDYMGEFTVKKIRKQRQSMVSDILDAGPEHISIPRSVIVAADNYHDLGLLISLMIGMETLTTLTPEQEKIVTDQRDELDQLRLDEKRLRRKR